MNDIVLRLFVPKPYTRINLTESELDLLRGCVSSSQDRLREKAVSATDPPEKEWYWGQVEKFDLVRKKLEQPGFDDHSQDAEKDEDEEEGP
jgi:hypothetical protein